MPEENGRDEETPKEIETQEAPQSAEFTLTDKTELLKALLEASSEFMPIEKNKTNPFLKNKYASLDSVNKACDPALKKYGLKVIHRIGAFPGREGFWVHTVLFHAESGQFLDSWYKVEAMLNEKGVNAEQVRGKGITYGTRYTKCSLLGVVADEDIDGNDASQQSNDTNTRQNGGTSETTKEKNQRLMAEQRAKEQHEAKQTNGTREEGEPSADDKTEPTNNNKEEATTEEEPLKNKEELDLEAKETAARLAAIKRGGFHVCKFMQYEDEKWKAECLERYDLKESRSEMTFENWSDWIDKVKSRMDEKQAREYEILGKIKQLSTPLTEKGIDGKKLGIYLQVRFIAIQPGKLKDPSGIYNVLKRAVKDVDALKERVEEVTEWITAVGKVNRTDDHTKKDTNYSIGILHVGDLLRNFREALDQDKKGALPQAFSELMHIELIKGVCHLNDIKPEVLKEVIEKDEDGNDKPAIKAWAKILEQACARVEISFSADDIPF